ncbi:unnamed protein product [Effrenium voratum]|uniref:NADP-dependent oxidoreductase domain-containing protein n=1 Tax=Effrenium voratum TaxID=2562239 RepID=A0AA36IWI9_9DINO|nr:unnamed protein product [Effrenium voratum]
MEGEAQIGGLQLRWPLAIGTMQWGRTWLDEKLNRGNLSDETCAAIYKELTEVHGIQLFDTAEGYGGGTSEERLRDMELMVADEKRTGPVVATKFLPTLLRWTEASFRRALKSSLKRLGQTRSDIYFIHTPIHPLPLEVWVRAAAKAKKEGLIREIGISNCNAQQVQRACAEAEKHGCRIAANQIMFNLLCFNSPELQATAKVCKEKNVRIIAFGTVGQGLLVDNLTEEKFGKIRLAKMTGLQRAEIEELRAAIERLAQKYQKSMAQICLNWTICHGAIPLVGTRSVQQARDSVGALGWRLDPEDVLELDAKALRRSTLSKPRWKRALFVIAISLLVCSYQVNHLVAWARCKWRSLWAREAAE